MIKTSYNSKLSEKIIIDKFLKKLNLNKKGTFNFENDAACVGTIVLRVRKVSGFDNIT